MATLTVGEVRENVAKALTCPEYIGSVVDALYGKGSVLSDKRRLLAEKYNKRKRKSAPEPVVEPIIVSIGDEEEGEDGPSASQDMDY